MSTDDEDDEMVLAVEAELLKMPRRLPKDVVELVIAARRVAFEGITPEMLSRLDKASEAFADRVPWEDEPKP